VDGDHPPLLPRRDGDRALDLSSWLFHGDYSGSAYQFTQDVEWIPALGIRYSVGVDGISYWLVLLTTVLTPISLYVSFNSVTTKIKEYAFASSSSRSG
jgi:NADH-quinone oxidoreductase subunit M